MDDALSSTDSLFSPLSVGSDLSTLDGNFASTTSPSSSPTGSVSSSYNGTQSAPAVSGFQSVLNGLTSLFSSGVAAYNSVAKETGLPLANGTSTVAPTAVAPTAVFAGLTSQQLLLIAGGAALIIFLVIAKRR